MSNSRRIFLKKSLVLPSSLFLGINTSGMLTSFATANDNEVKIEPFLRLSVNGELTVIIKHLEFGQGIVTGLITLVAEELNYPIDLLKYEFAPANKAIFKNTLFGTQMTGASTSMANSFIQYRRIGAAARELFILAGATLWKKNRNKVELKDGLITSGTQSMTLSALFPVILTLEPPSNPKLKDPSDFQFIGNENVVRNDNLEKITGQAKFGMDVQIDNQIYAGVINAPKFGGKVLSFDSTQAKSVNGFIKARMKPDNSGVVVYCDSTWSVFEAQKNLSIIWDFSKAETRSSDDIKEELMAKVSTAPQFIVLEKNIEKTHQQALEKIKIIEKFFYFPFLAHAPMEPLNCTIEHTGNGVTLYNGGQLVTQSKTLLSKIIGLPKSKVKVNTMYAGGSFGRRLGDYVKDAAYAFRLFGSKHTIKLVMSRENDVQGGYYRPAVAHRVQVKLNEVGEIVSWDHQVATHSIFKNRHFLDTSNYSSIFVKEGHFDPSSVDGVYHTLYKIPQFSLGLTNVENPIPVSTWRSVSHSHTAFVMESMMDIVASQSNQDPIQYRKKYLSQTYREQNKLLNVLNIVEIKSNWDKPRRINHFMGVAVHQKSQTCVAIVAELSRNEAGAFQIENVTCVVDCGLAVNPDTIIAQMEGGIGFGAGHIMKAEITLKDGEVEQSNFSDYSSLLINDIKNISVYIVPSTSNPTGVGEASTPPIGPAIANAIAEAGLRITYLPLNKHGAVFV